jgi:hypothetical protein
MLRNNRNPQTSLKFRLSRLTGIRAFRGRRQRSAQRATLSEAGARVQWAQTFWGRKLIKSTTLALALLCSASVVLADIKITTKSEASGQSMTSTTYIKGTRQRTEGIGYTIIYQCDLKRMIQLNDKTRTYLITPLDKGSASGGAGSQSAGSRTRRGGVITYTTTSTDTGERKEMLGLTAKHIKSKTVIAASEGACTPMNMEMETDGWYVSLPGNFNCQTDAAAPMFPTEQSECVDEYHYKTEGVVNTGYPLMTTTRMKFNTGADEPSMNIPASTSTQEVVDISKSPLDASLFEIPAGYREVKTAQELGSPY